MTRILLPFLIIVSLFLGIAGFLIYQNYQLRKQLAQQVPTSPIRKTLLKPSPNPSPSTNILTKYRFFPDIKTEFQKIKEKYSGKVSETYKLGVLWISPDNLSIINDGSPGIELYIFNCSSAPPSFFKEITQLVSPKIDEIMEQNGFQINQKNLSNSIEDHRFYDYIRGYEKEATKCVFNADPDCSIDSLTMPAHYTFSFGCTEAFGKNYQQQAPYLKDLEINDASIRVQKRIGDFVELNVNSRRGGYVAFAKLINGKWREIYSGQDFPSCEIVEKYKIPKEIVPNCYLSKP